MTTMEQKQYQAELNYVQECRNRIAEMLKDPSVNMQAVRAEIDKLCNTLNSKGINSVVDLKRQTVQAANQTDKSVQQMKANMAPAQAADGMSFQKVAGKLSIMTSTVFLVNALGRAVGVVWSWVLSLVRWLKTIGWGPIGKWAGVAGVAFVLLYLIQKPIHKFLDKIRNKQQLQREDFEIFSTDGEFLQETSMLREAMTAERQLQILDGGISLSQKVLDVLAGVGFVSAGIGAIVLNMAPLIWVTMIGAALWIMLMGLRSVLNRKRDNFMGEPLPNQPPSSQPA